MQSKNSFYCLILLALLFACEKDPKKYVDRNRNSILSVLAQPDFVEADGKSQLPIYAGISSKADIKTIKFTTTYGTFADTNTTTFVATAQTKGDSLFAYAYLVPTLDTNDRVTINVSDGIDTTFNVRFIKAYPDSINIESSVASIKKEFGSEVPLQAFLILNILTPFLHQAASFGAWTSTNTPIGEFRAISPSGSDSNGIINSIFVLKDTIYTGPIRIFATAQGKAKPLSDTLKVFVTQ
jgi:hypothetical protein